MEGTYYEINTLNGYCPFSLDPPSTTYFIGLKINVYN